MVDTIEQKNDLYRSTKQYVLYKNKIKFLKQGMRKVTKP